MCLSGFATGDFSFEREDKWKREAMGGIWHAARLKDGILQRGWIESRWSANALVV